MKALILTVGLGLVAALLPTTWSEQSPDLSGKWYIKAIILDVDGTPEINVETPTQAIVTAVDGDRVLHAQFTLPTQGQCQLLNTTLRKIQDPGEYLAEKYETVLHVKPLPVKDNYVIYCDVLLPGRVIRMAKLVGRDMSMNQEAVEAFKNHVSALGYNPNHVVVPKQTDTCPADEQ